MCNQSERIFADAIQSSASNDFRSFAGRIRQLLNECGFQLRIEIQRISTECNGVWLVDDRVISRGAGCRSVLSNLLEGYRGVLRSHIPPHTRAMIKRQYQQLQRLCDELTEFVQSLAGLLSTKAGLA